MSNIDQCAICISGILFSFRKDPVTFLGVLNCGCWHASHVGMFRWEEAHMVEGQRGGISYLFTSNHVTLLRSSGFFPSLLFSPAEALQVRNQTRTQEQGLLLPQLVNTVAGSQ